MKFKGVGTVETADPPNSYEEKLEKGDIIVISTGERLMCVAVGATGWLFKSLNGRGKPFLTTEELLALDAELD